MRSPRNLQDTASLKYNLSSLVFHDNSAADGEAALVTLCRIRLSASQ